MTVLLLIYDEFGRQLEYRPEFYTKKASLKQIPTNILGSVPETGLGIPEAEKAGQLRELKQALREGIALIAQAPVRIPGLLPGPFSQDDEY